MTPNPTLDEKNPAPGLRTELEGIRTAFHTLLRQTPDLDLYLPSGNPYWTIGEVLYHIAFILKDIPVEVRLLQNEIWYPILPPKIFHRINPALTRLASLGFDRQSILRQYDRAHQRILNSMSTVRDDQWSLGRDYPNQDPPILSGFVTIEDMFHYPKAHFEQHQRDIQFGLARVEEIMEHARSRRQQGDHEPEPGEPGGLISYPHSPWRRALFKAPISLWRLGLAPLIGGFLMLLTHTGRKTGLPHRTMVEYHKVAGRIYAPCAFGPRSDWFKNVTHDPRVTVQTAGGVEHARAVRVQDDRELLAVYYRFKRRDPPLTRWYLDSVGVRDDSVDVLTKKDRIYWVRFDPIQEQTPAPLKSDLAWVWPLLGIGLLGYWLYSRIRRKPS